MVQCIRVQQRRLQPAAGEAVEGEHHGGGRGGGAAAADCGGDGGLDGVVAAAAASAGARRDAKEGVRQLAPIAQEQALHCRPRFNWCPLGRCKWGTV
jgi:hypothetical protein